MVFDKIFIPCHVSVNHIKMSSRTAKSNHGLFIVSFKLWIHCKKDDILQVEHPWSKWTARIPTVKLKIPGKSIFEIRNQNFCYIQVIVFDLKMF